MFPRHGLSPLSSHYFVEHTYTEYSLIGGTNFISFFFFSYHHVVYITYIYVHTFYNFCQLQNDILYRRSVSHVDYEARTGFLSFVDLLLRSYAPTTRLYVITYVGTPHVQVWKQISVSLQATATWRIMSRKTSQSSIYIRCIKSIHTSVAKTQLWNVKLKSIKTRLKSGLDALKQCDEFTYLYILKLVRMATPEKMNGPAFKRLKTYLRNGMS